MMSQTEHPIPPSGIEVKHASGSQKGVIERYRSIVSNPLGQGAALALLTVALVYFRRPDQFTHPYIWVEDGTFILVGFVQRGWWSLFEPVQGYLITATKLITLAAYQISILKAPEVAVWLTTVFTVAVVLAIAFSPTQLRHRYLCALIVLLIPTDSEIYGVSEYAFWWAGLLLPLVVLWDESKGRDGLRLAFTVFGGLSSPLVVPFAPLLVIRSALERTRQSVTIASAAVLCTLVQLEMLRRTGTIAASPPFAPGDLALVVGKFLGYFVGSRFVGDVASVDVGVIVLTLVVAAITYSHWKLDRWFVFLMVMLAMVVAITLRRVPMPAIHPYLAGPRYFFYAYIFIAWGLLWLIAEGARPVRTICGLILAVGVAQGITRLPRYQAVMSWKAHILNCTASPSYDVPIFFTGSADPALLWKVTLTGQQCRDLINRSLLRGTNVQF
jgi:hypothetical protein